MYNEAKLIVFDNLSADKKVKEIIKYPFVEIHYFYTEN